MQKQRQRKSAAFVPHAPGVCGGRSRHRPPAVLAHKPAAQPAPAAEHPGSAEIAIVPAAGAEAGPRGGAPQTSAAAPGVLTSNGMLRLDLNARRACRARARQSRCSRSPGAPRLCPPSNPPRGCETARSPGQPPTWRSGPPQSEWCGRQMPQADRAGNQRLTSQWLPAVPVPPWFSRRAPSRDGHAKFRRPASRTAGVTTISATPCDLSRQWRGSEGDAAVAQAAVMV